MTKRNFLFLLLCLTLLFTSMKMVFNTNAASNVILVPGNYQTIQEAINAANPGDTIQVSSGMYNECLFINKTLTLKGEGYANTIINGSGCGFSAVIQVNLTTVKISGFTIEGRPNGIALEKCSGSSISENNIVAGARSIWLHYSNNNTVSDNTVSGSISWCGIVLCGHSSNNTVIRNTIKENEYGIGITGEGNIIYHNNFIENRNQSILVITSYPNIWNNTCEGNYYSDYNGTDVDEDGIGDIPYTIDENNIDNHPLMGMFSQFKVQHNGDTHVVTTICNSTITAFSFRTDPENAISFNVTGPEGTLGFCRIRIPHALLESTYIIVVDGLPPIMEKPLSISNSTHTYLYFTYMHTEHEVVIVPEFSSAIILTLMIILGIGLAYAARKTDFIKKQQQH